MTCCIIVTLELKLYVLSRGIRGSDFTDWTSIHDFADYEFSIQSNPRIGEIQSKSNPYICKSNVDLTQSISNPPFYELICRSKIFNFVQFTNKLIKIF